LWAVTQVSPYVDGPAGVHAVLPQATVALSELARMAGLEPVAVTDVADLPASDLRGEGVLALFTIGETPWSDSQREAIVSGWREGRLGVLGIHASTDANHQWDEYGTVLGGRFDGHPWTQDFTVAVVDHDHPATAHFGDTFTWHDEVYLFDQLRPDARVLLQLADPAGELDMSVDEARTPSIGFPLAWCHSEDKGRTFYSALGHFPWAWETPFHLRYLAGGLQWVLGDGR
jgi:type 1 glutamine amidotransferase